MAPSVFKTDNVRRWKDFCRSPAVRGITHETLRNDRQEEFLLFCDGLFAKLVCEIDGVAERSGVESDSTFDRCVPSVLTVYAVLGMSACAFAALRPASAQWVTTLRKVDPNLVNELPYDCLIALFNDAILARMIAQPVKPLVSSINLDTEAGRLEQTNVVDGLASEEHKQTYLMCKPELKKPIVLNFLRPEPQFPLSREQSMTPIRSAADALDAVGDEWRKSLPMSKAYALSQAVLVVPPPDDMSLGDMAITLGNPSPKPWQTTGTTSVDRRCGAQRVDAIPCEQHQEHLRSGSFASNGTSIFAHSRSNRTWNSFGKRNAPKWRAPLRFGGPATRAFPIKTLRSKSLPAPQVLRLHGEQTVESGSTYLRCSRPLGSTHCASRARPNRIALGAPSVSPSSNYQCATHRATSRSIAVRAGFELLREPAFSEFVFAASSLRLARTSPVCRPAATGVRCGIASSPRCRTTTRILYRTATL